MKRLGCFVVLLLAFAANGNAADKWFWGLQAAGAADFFSHELVLAHANNGHENNPVQKNSSRAVRAASKVGTNAAVWLLARELEKAGHDNFAKGLRWSAVSAQVGASGWNVSVAIRF